MEQGLYVMAVGMGTVFAFLGLLVLVMKAAAAVFRNFPEDAAVVATGSSSSAPASSRAADAEEARRIAIAIAAATAWREGYRPKGSQTRGGQ